MLRVCLFDNICCLGKEVRLKFCVEDTSGVGQAKRIILILGLEEGELVGSDG